MPIYDPQLGRVKPSFAQVEPATIATHTILAPAGVKDEHVVVFIDVTALAAGANTVTVQMGSNPVWVVKLFNAGDYRFQAPDNWRGGNNQPLLVTLTAALGVHINVTYYDLPAYA